MQLLYFKVFWVCIFCRRPIESTWQEGSTASCHGSLQNRVRAHGFTVTPRLYSQSLQNGLWSHAPVIRFLRGPAFREETEESTGQVQPTENQLHSLINSLSCPWLPFLLFYMLSQKVWETKCNFKGLSYHLFERCCSALIRYLSDLNFSFFIKCNAFTWAHT